MISTRPLIALFALLAVNAVFAADPAPDAPPAATDQGPKHTRVRIATNLGVIVVELEDERAPLTVANFLQYVREGHYNGTTFHHVAVNFVVQGGGFTPDFRKKPARDGVFNESGNGLKNARGTIGMARGDKNPHSAQAQFFFNLTDNADLDPLPTRWGYAVFGHIVQGLDVLDRIGNVATGAGGDFKEDVPVKAVIMEKVEIVP
ncbi:MAG TPA: peptidylprolyl isomerase [Steroidobacteraceae bacterium]|nr:peptidylprolyl isomerase [Steroidobacteraceae bacterium]